MPSVTIDAITFIYADNLLGLTQEINVDASIDFLDGQALINAIRQAESSTIGMTFPRIADASGKAQLSSGVFVGTTIQLLDNWKIYTLKNSGSFSIGGANIVKSDGSTIFVNNPSVTYIQNLAVASTQVSTSGSGSGGSLTPADVWNYTSRSLTTAFPTIPTASQNATAVRTELSIELARIDQPISNGFTGGDRTALFALPTLAQIEASNVLAKETTLKQVKNLVAAGL